MGRVVISHSLFSKDNDLPEALNSSGEEKVEIEVEMWAT